jgi:polysaccharide deacetylase family protein (PEP-CTERM system associated)
MSTGPEHGTLSSLALSVDVEDYFQVEAFANHVNAAQWPHFPSRVRENTLRVLAIFARFQTKATFFILGCVAAQDGSLVREIVSAGHEIGCHSFSHHAIWRLSPQQFREDTRRARHALEQAAGVQVLGYRAPTFSVTARTLWALEILAEEGFQYDSSVFPIRHDMYGMPGAPRFPFQWRTAQGLQLCEFPMTTTRIFGQNLPASGGGYLRLLPLWYSRWATARVVAENRPAMLYFHPWELDPAQPRIAASWKSRLRHYTNLEGMQARLENLLRSWQWTTVGETLRREMLRGLPVFPCGPVAERTQSATAR